MQAGANIGAYSSEVFFTYGVQFLGSLRANECLIFLEKYTNDIALVISRLGKCYVTSLYFNSI